MYINLVCWYRRIYILEKAKRLRDRNFESLNNYCTFLLQSCIQVAGGEGPHVKIENRCIYIPDRERVQVVYKLPEMISRMRNKKLNNYKWTWI